MSQNNQEDLPENQEQPIEASHGNGIDNTQETSIADSTISEATTPENMEVHYHPHLPEGKKKFKHYFSEFFMIFMAVTMGFIAENIREHFAENAKEKEYIHSFVEGLKADTADIRGVMAFNNIKLKGLDSITALAGKDMHDKNNLLLLYRLTSKYLSNYSIFKGSDITMQQLKYAGDLRMIRKKHMADSLVTYDELAKSVNEQGEVTVKMFMSISDLEEQLFNFSYWLNPATLNNNVNNLDAIRDPAKLQWLFNKVGLYKAVLDYYNNGLLPDNLKEATQLLEVLEKNYGIER